MPFSSTRRPILLIADHASNAVPDGIDLGLQTCLMDTHIAVDIGTAKLTTALADRLQALALLASASRLVIDCNRAPDDPGAIPEVSDGIEIPGNIKLGKAERQRRIDDVHAPYHDAIAKVIDRGDVELLVSIHSFTPCLGTHPDAARPWHAGLLYNRDARAARIAIARLEEEGLTIGDNQPYSGAVYGYTTDRHAEARGLPYLFFEVRQDLLADADGIATWATRLHRVIDVVVDEVLNKKRRAVS